MTDKLRELLEDVQTVYEGTYCLRDKDVIAWKEIVLPKEMKENADISAEKRMVRENQFPNDEFLQSAVSQIVDKCTADLEQKLGIERSSRIALVNKIAELEEKISVLLSCKNCPENKDGLICRKEYENKCLAQKIQFIKELQQENAELKKGI